MRTDPPEVEEPEVREDGLCAREGCTARLIKSPPKTMPKNLRTTFLPALRADPFCSAKCCRAFYNAQENNNPTLINHGVPTNHVTKDHSRYRAEYRAKHAVPCEGGCGKLVEGKGRSNPKGKNPNRPYMCVVCSGKWRAEQRRIAKAVAA